MKLWYQSVASLSQDPMWNDYQRTVVEHISLVKQPETQVDVKGLKVTIPQATESAYLEYLNIYQILENAERAEAEGYDGFILGCFTDPGHDILRSILDIPVIFTGETSMHLACLLGKKFAFVGRNERVSKRIFTNIKDYGLSERALPSVFLDVSLEALAGSFKNPTPLLAPFFKKCEEVIALGGEVIIPGCGVMNAFLAFHKVNSYKGALILNTLASAIKVAETMVELKRKVGIHVSRIGNYSSPEKSVAREAKKALMKM